MAKINGRDRQRENRWRLIIRRHESSGQGVREFCRRSELNESAFYFWRRELQRRQTEQEQHRPADPPAVPAFLAVRLDEQAVGAAPAGRIVIELSGGRRVQVAAPVDRQALADVLAVLESVARWQGDILADYQAEGGSAGGQKETGGTSFANLSAPALAKARAAKGEPC